MMYIEFQELFSEAQKRRPADKRMECPDPSLYANCVEPFYMTVKMDKPDFVNFYIANRETVEIVSQQIALKDEALCRRAESLEKAAADEQKLKIRLAELERQVADLEKQNDGLAKKAESLYNEMNSLCERHIKLVRSLCKDCFAKFVFGHTPSEIQQ